MFAAVKVGTAAFKVGKLAANTGKTLRALQNDVKLWEIQINYYIEFFNHVRAKIPHSLYQLSVARTRVTVAYIQNLKEQIKKAQTGTKKTQMKLIAKASGEIGSTFLQDIEVFFVNLEESYQLCLNHISLHQVHKVDLILAKLESIGQPVANELHDSQFIGSAVGAVVQSRRLIFILQAPQGKVKTGEKIQLTWTTAGAIPHVKVAMQVSSIVQQAQDRAKKTWVTIAEEVKTNEDAIGYFEWEIPHDFVKRYGKHGNYAFKISYSPPQQTPEKEESLRDVKSSNFIGTSLVGKNLVFDTPVKAHTDTFKITEPKHSSKTESPKKEEKEKEKEKEREKEKEEEKEKEKTEPKSGGLAASFGKAGSSAVGKASSLLKRK